MIHRDKMNLEFHDYIFRHFVSAKTRKIERIISTSEKQFLASASERR